MHTNNVMIGAKFVEVALDLVKLSMTWIFQPMLG